MIDGLSVDNNPLRDYVLSVMEEDDLNLKDIQRLSQERSGDDALAYATIQQIVAGKTPNPGIFTLVKLAQALGRPVEDLLNATLGGTPAESPAYRSSDFANLEGIYSDLPHAEKKAMKRYHEMLRREMLRILKRPTR